MPAAVTHYLCGNRVLKLIKNNNIKDTITNRRSIFNLGTQGPDIFFYYGAWPWSKNKGIPKLGNRIHKEKTGKFFAEALKYIIESDEPSKGILTAYMYGYLCHYVLDCRIHPYVFYKTGFIRRGEEYSAKFNCYHRMFEASLDVLMLKHEFNKKPRDIKVSETIAISREAADVISEMYSKVLMHVHDIDVGNEYVCQAINDTVGIAAALRDVIGIKKSLLLSIEKVLGRPPLFSSMIMPLKVKDDLDYLNSSHRVWYPPWDDSQELTSSFIENFEAAVSESTKIIEATFSCLTGKIDLESLMLLIGNRSFTTGEDCDLDLEFKYYDCVYD
jgi:hypothetical protein